MHNQPKFVPAARNRLLRGRPLRPAAGGEHGGARPAPRDSYFYTGMVDGKEGDSDALPGDAGGACSAGQERYNIYCTPCHSRVGNGAGMIVQRGYAPAGNFHTPRMQADPLGHFFNVITNGYGAMPDYAAQITVADRWAIVAYIKALQLSQNAKQADVAAGSQVESLTTIAEQEGLPADLPRSGRFRQPRSTARPTIRTMAFQVQKTNAASGTSGGRTCDDRWLLG